MKLVFSSLIVLAVFAAVAVATPTVNNNLNGMDVDESVDTERSTFVNPESDTPLTVDDEVKTIVFSK